MNQAGRIAHYAGQYQSGVHVPQGEGDNLVQSNQEYQFDLSLASDRTHLDLEWTNFANSNDSRVAKDKSQLVALVLNCVSQQAIKVETHLKI